MRNGLIGMNSTIIEILIPTFNRKKFLIQNLEKLHSQIKSAKLTENILITISDNASTDDTQKMVLNFVQKNPTLQLNYTRNKKNIGLEPNAVKLLQIATAPYIMWLGDDDFLADGYLKFCIDRIQSENIGFSITGAQQLKKDNQLVDVRDLPNDHIKIRAGYLAIFGYSHLASQLSGLLVIRHGLYEAYTKYEKFRNPYCFIFFLNQTMLEHDGYFSPSFKTTIVDFNEKDWGYNSVGLLNEVYKSYYFLLDHFTSAQVSKLLLRFTVLHSYRLAFSPLNVKRLITQFGFLIRTTPKLKGFSLGLLKIFIKDGIKSLLRLVK